MNNCIRPKQNKKPLVWLEPVLIVVVCLLAILSLMLGAVNVPAGDVFDALFSSDAPARTIVIFLRLPRALACILVGAALSCSGLLLQTMLNNSLASPGIIGINSGAGLFAVMLSIWFSASLIGQTIATFLGAFLASMLIYALGRTGGGASRSKLILAGLAISRLFAALIDAIIVLNPDAMYDRAAFQLGTMARANMANLSFAAPVIIVGLIGALLLSRYLGVLVLGDDVATSLGLNVRRCRFICLLVVSLLAGGAVSLCGLLGFLGLIAPHIVRRLVGTDSYVRLTVTTALFGAALTLLCDLISKTVAAPFELPVGILMAILGVPFFIFLIFGKGGSDRVAAN